MHFTDLPTINAGLNMLSAVFLICGYRNVMKGDIQGHKRCMTLALIASLMFLTCYLIYHFNVGSVAYPLDDWTRILYLSILAPHVILAALNLPFIILLVRRAFKGDFKKHKRLARWVWPVWMFVSVTGVIIYCMLYIYAGASA